MNLDCGCRINQVGKIYPEQSCDIHKNTLLKNIHNKLKGEQTLTEKEIDFLIDEHWLEWTCKYELEPCGQLTYNGKLEYIQDNYQTIIELINEFPLSVDEAEKLMTVDRNCLS